MMTLLNIREIWVKKKKDRKKERTKARNGQTDGWIDRQMTDDKPQTTNRRQTERQNPSKVLGSLKFQEQTSRLVIWDTNKILPVSVTENVNRKIKKLNWNNWNLGIIVKDDVPYVNDV